MKPYGKKISFLYTVLVLGVLASFYLGEIFTFSPGQKLFIGIVCILGGLAVGLVPKHKTAEEILEESDERNQYIAMKCASESLKVVATTCFLCIMACLICFGLTHEFTFIWLLIGSALPYGILKISMIVNTFRFDR